MSDEQCDQSGDAPDIWVWPFLVADAPIRCGFCEEPIVGTGTGHLSALRGALMDHKASCEGVQSNDDFDELYGLTFRNDRP